jgi:hypothetical protein
MSAKTTVQDSFISVSFYDRLSYADWKILREACDLAATSKLPLRIDVASCTSGDFGGVGSVLIAQEKLGKVEIQGCSSLFADCFKAFGVCASCTHGTSKLCKGRRQEIKAER